MNTHKILSHAGYNQRTDYPEIAKFAAQKVKEVDLTKQQLLKLVSIKYGELASKQTMLDRPQPFNIWGDVGSDIEYGAVEQMNNVMSLPVSIRGAMMPDAHVGYGMPIGGVAALDNAISPGFVGYDIACRMTMTILDIDIDEFYEDRMWFFDCMHRVSSFGMGAGFDKSERRDHEVLDDPLWSDLPHVKNLFPLAWQQLGSSGGGNHFFDAVIGEVVDGADWMPLGVGEKFVAIITHSGSRGTGHKLATYYVQKAKDYTRTIAKNIPSGYEWLDLDTELGQEYLAVMNLMGRYAQANHHLIHQYFMDDFGVDPIAQYENHHNFAWLGNEGEVVHRKGATPAHHGVPGIIPGTSGTPSYLVSGLGNPDSIESSSHGAGRPFSRTEAKRRHDETLVRNWMQDNDIWTSGLAQDETFMAYKDIDRVMELQSDLVRVVAKMYPKLVVMGGKSDDGD